MAKRRGSCSAERSHGSLHVAAVAIAIVAYILIPVVHAGHHLLDHRPAASADGSVVTVSEGCRHHSCRGHTTGNAVSKGASPDNEQVPADEPHDHSSCEICHALAAARKHVDLPLPAIALLPSTRWHHPAEVAPEADPSDPVLLPRSSRGPPLNS